MIEMGVTHDDGVGARHEMHNRLEIRCETAKYAATQRRPRNVRIDQHDVFVATNLESGRSQPANMNASFVFGNEFVPAKFQMFGVHRRSYIPIHPPGIDAIANAFMTRI